MPKLNARNCCLYVPVNIYIYEKIQQFLSSIKRDALTRKLVPFFCLMVYIFHIKCTEAISTNSTQKLLWLEITKMLIAVGKKNYCVIYYNFRHIILPCCAHSPIFAQRVIRPWNSLKLTPASMSSLWRFKALLSNADLSRFLHYS